MMRYLLDEHLAHAIQEQLARRTEELEVRFVGGPQAPRKETPDRSLLIWCEENRFTLVSKDYRTMGEHVAAHLAAGRHLPGVFLIPPRFAMRDVLEELTVIAFASFEDEFRDQIRFLPVS